MKKLLMCLCLFQITFMMATNPSMVEPEKVNVSVRTVNGRELKGMMQLPYVNSTSVELINGINKQSIESSDIESILTFRKGSGASSAIRLIYVPSYEYKSVKDDEPRLNKQPKWMIDLLELENISLYMVSQQYDLNYSLAHSPESLKETIPSNHWLYVQRTGELYPTRISLTPNSGHGSNQHFKAVALKYFQDCPELCGLIEKGDFTNQNIVDVILFYNNCSNR